MQAQKKYVSRTVIVDFMNLAHRARSGFTAGDFAVVYNFFRGFRALVELLKPDRIVVALEGTPKFRTDLLTEYKANRAIDIKTDVAMQNFFRQVGIIKDLLTRHFPVSVVRHPHREADDTIYNVIKQSSSVTEFVVVSNDSDFTQLLQDFENVSIFAHPKL